MAKKAMDGGVMTNPLKLNDLVKSAGEAFVLDTGGTEIGDFVFTLRGVAANDMVMLRTNDGAFNSVKEGAEEREVLKPISLEMFKAVKYDKLAEFIAANPSVIPSAERCPRESLLTALPARTPKSSSSEDASARSQFG